MITFKKTFDYYATDNELGDYITLMADVVIGDVDPQIEFDVERECLCKRLGKYIQTRNF